MRTILCVIICWLSLSEFNNQWPYICPEFDIVCEVSDHLVAQLKFVWLCYLKDRVIMWLKINTWFDLWLWQDTWSAFRKTWLDFGKRHGVTREDACSDFWKTLTWVERGGGDFIDISSLNLKHVIPSLSHYCNILYGIRWPVGNSGALV